MRALPASLIIWLLLSGSSLADQIIADGVISTSLVRVLAHPEKYQGKRIELIGYYRSEFEHSALYLTKDDAKISNLQNSLWLGTPAPGADETKIKPIKRGFVRVIGTFEYDRNRGSGHFGMWPGELKEITFLNTKK